MKPLQQWLEEYAESHTNRTNKILHFICIPSIYLSILGMLFSLKIHLSNSSFQCTAALIAALLVVIYYLRLSFTIAIGVLVINAAGLVFWNIVERAGIAPWLVAVIIFVLAWIGQFIGHDIEKHRPSFFKDLQFLLIGPAWILSFIYKKLGIRI